MIKDLHEEVEIRGTLHREIIHLPERVEMRTVLAIVEQVAHKTQHTIQHLYFGGVSNDEKSKEVLLAKEKTKHAEIEGLTRVRMAELKLEMTVLTQTCGQTYAHGVKQGGCIRTARRCFFRTRAQL